MRQWFHDQKYCDGAPVGGLALRLPVPKRAGKIAVLLPSLEGGGAERSMLNLVKGFLAQGREVDLVLCRAKGAYLDQVPDEVSMVELEATGGFLTRWLAAMANISLLPVLLRPVLLATKAAPEIARLRSLRRYMDTCRPDVVLSALTYANLVAIWAKHTAEQQVPVVVSERIALTTHCTTPSNSRKWRWRYLPELVRKAYPGADAVLAVSNQVAEDLVSVVGLDSQLVQAVYNPVVDDVLRSGAANKPEHPWFSPGAAPVILGVGRLTEQKDFPALIRAFAVVRKQMDARLVILGEGRQRGELENLGRELGIEDDVALPGFAENPFQYMAHASVFVLSSEYEGLPGVLIQALACGCPVVSTDCPGGSAEILENGKYGPLVGIGDVEGMAAAIVTVLNKPPPSDVLLRRAEDFSAERATSNYLGILDAVVANAVDRG